MVLTLSTVFFILINLAVSPFYLLMVAAPRAALTRRWLAPLWPVALPALVHVAFIVAILVVARPNVLQLWQSLYLEHGVLGTTTVSMLSQLYGQHPEYAALHGWATSSSAISSWPAGPTSTRLSAPFHPGAWPSSPPSSALWARSASPSTCSSGRAGRPYA